MAGGIVGLDADDFGLVEQNAIGNDLGFETGGAELARDILGGLVIFRCGGEMRSGGELFEFLAGLFGIGDGEEFLFDFGFGTEVGVAEDGLRRLPTERAEQKG